MYCDKWENWTDCCRNNIDRFCEVNNLRDFHENSSDNADDLSDTDSSDNEDDLSNSTARLMTASVVRLITDLTARTRTDLIMILIINLTTTLMTDSALRLNWLTVFDWWNVLHTDEAAEAAETDRTAEADN